MNGQPKWDIYESVVLLEGYLYSLEKSVPRSHIISRVSSDLRIMAVHRGMNIDEVYRNVSGISYQMQSMDSAYKGKKIYVSATKLFQETVSIYRNQNSRFQELLKEARYMIKHDNTQLVRDDISVLSSNMLALVGTIISDTFPNGFRKSSQIARKKFANAYKDTTGTDFPEDIDLDALAIQVGLEYEDKIYVPSEEMKKFLRKLIDDIREKDYRLIYYEEMYNTFSEQLSADQIFSAEMLKTVLEVVAPEMVFYKTYACFSKNDSLVDDIIRVYGSDIYIDYREIKSRLPYVDLYQIRLTCSRSTEFVSMGDEVYALSKKINLSESDVENARKSIEEDIIENNFSKLGSIDVYESECMNPGINASALRALLFDRYLSKDYDRKRSIITRKGTKIRVYDAMKEFCLEHERISVDEIEAYERDISGNCTYGLNAAFDSLIRVDKEIFVHRDMVFFDVEAIDYAISTYVQNGVFPLADIKSFTSFPYVDGYPWNSFLLDSFCSHYSKKFRSIGGPSKQDIIGAIYPIHMTFDGYTSLLAKAAADSGLELTEKIIGDFFSAHKYWLRKSKLSDVLAAAQELRLKEEQSFVRI